MNLWPWPLTLRVFHVQCFSFPTHTPIIIIPRLSVTELWVKHTEFGHISVIRHSHCACAVSRDLSSGAKIVHIFEIPEPNLPIYFVTFRALQRRLSHDIGEKIAFIPLWRLQSLLRMRSITWPVYRRSPKTTRDNFLTPNCLFTIQLLWGYDDG